MRTRARVGVIVVAVLAASAAAGPLIYEGFDYALGEHLAGQDSATADWAGPWSVNAPVANDLIVTGLTFQGPRYRLTVSGQAVQLSTWQLDSFAVRPLAVGSSTGDLWVSYLVNIDGDATGERVVEVRVNPFEFGDYLAALFRTIPKSFQDTAPAVGYDYFETHGGPPGSVAAGTTYLVVARFPDIGSVIGGPATLWLVSPEDFAAMDLTGGVMSLADLDNHHTATATDNHENLVLAAGHFVQLVLYSNISATYDELRYGTSLVDVVPLVGGLRGDMNCDGALTYADINPFVLALSNRAAFEERVPGCNWMNADTNGDGIVSYADINPFINCLSHGGCP